jgi:hypothetical protein
MSSNDQIFEQTQIFPGLWVRGHFSKHPSLSVCAMITVSTSALTAHAPVEIVVNNGLGRADTICDGWCGERIDSSSSNHRRGRVLRHT